MRLARVASLAVLAALVAGPLPALASGSMKTQVPTGAKAPAGGFTTTKGASTKTSAPPPIKVEAVGLGVSPQFPKDGDTVTVTFTIKNTGSGAVAKVPWAIQLVGTGNLASGNLTNLAPGQSQSVPPVTLVAKYKGHLLGFRVLGYVDPTGRELANTAPVERQILERSVVVRSAREPMLAVQVNGNGYVGSLAPNSNAWSESGIRCGRGVASPNGGPTNICSFPFRHGGTVRLEAWVPERPPSVRWGGACASAATRTCVVTLTSEVTTVVATFE